MLSTEYPFSCSWRSPSCFAVMTCCDMHWRPGPLGVLRYETGSHLNLGSADLQCAPVLDRERIYLSGCFLSTSKLSLGSMGRCQATGEHAISGGGMSPFGLLHCLPRDSNGRAPDPALETFWLWLPEGATRHFYPQSEGSLLCLSCPWGEDKLPDKKVLNPLGK